MPQLPPACKNSAACVLPAAGLLVHGGERVSADAGAEVAFTRELDGDMCG